MNSIVVSPLIFHPGQSLSVYGFPSKSRIGVSSNPVILYFKNTSSSNTDAWDKPAVSKVKEKLSWAESVFQFQYVSPNRKFSGSPFAERLNIEDLSR